MRKFTREELSKIKPKLSPEEYIQLVHYSFPSTWAETYLVNPKDLTKGIKLREYQRSILDDPSSKKILRLGRQVGKSLCICIGSLHKCSIVPQSKILIICPFDRQVKNLFEQQRYFIDNSKYLKEKILAITKQPHEIIFNNGSTIKGFTAGSSSGGKGDAVRGQQASDLYVDEADYVVAEAMESIQATMMAYAKDPFIWLSSTPTGRRSYFYDAYYSGQYKCWHYPSSISPDWTPEKEALFRANYSTAGYQHEFEGEWGTSEAGVFPLWALERINENSNIEIDGTTKPYSYSDADGIAKKHKTLVVGVDWNKTWGTRIILCSVTNKHQLYVLKKWRIDQSEFTQHEAITKIMEINEQYSPAYIFVDTGYGCVAPNTIVQTLEGASYISDLQIGDKVLTKSGKYKKVINKVTEISKQSYKLKPRKCPEIILSHCHPVLVYETGRKHRKFQDYSHVSPSDLVWKTPDKIDTKRDLLAIRKTKRKNLQSLVIDLVDYLDNDYIDFDDRFVWTKQGYKATSGNSVKTTAKIANCSKATIQRIRRLIRNNKELNKYQKSILESLHGKIGLKWTIPPKIKYNRYIDIASEEFQTILGWYLSEGYCGKNSVEITQADCNNYESFDKAIEFANNLFPSVNVIYKAVNDKNEHALRRLFIYGKIASDIFSTFGGKHADSKYIHPIVLETNMEHLLYAIILGDGCVQDQYGIKISLTSMRLIMQLRQYFIDWGFLPSLYIVQPQEKNNKIQYAITINDNYMNSQIITNITGHTICKKKGVDRRNWVDIGDFILISIAKLDKIGICDNLIDITVEDEPNFVGNGIVMHNSMQIEDLRLTGLMRPETGLKEKVIPVPTGSTIKINDIVTGEERSTPVKNFMVESTVRLVERGAVFAPKEEYLTTSERSGRVVKRLTLLDQMRNYYIDRYTSAGRPIYKGEEDHDLDAFMFCVYGVVTEMIKAQDLSATIPSPPPSYIDREKLHDIIDRSRKTRYDGSVERSIGFSFDPTSRQELNNAYARINNSEQVERLFRKHNKRKSRNSRGIQFSFSKGRQWRR